MRKLAENIVTYTVLMLAMGVFTNLFMGSQLGRDDLSASFHQTPIGLYVVEILVYLGCAVLAVMHYRRTLAALQAAWPVLLIAAMALLSTAWSVDPGTTLRRSIVLLWTTIFGVYLASRYSPEDFQRVLMRSLLVLLGISTLFLILKPDTVLDPSHTGAFRGLTEHKNSFGEFMAILLLLSLTYSFGRRAAAKSGVMIVLSMGFLAWAHSGSAILSVGITLVALPLPFLLRFRQSQMPALLLSGAATLGGVLLGVSHYTDAVLDLLGKDRSLTGRTQIWEAVRAAILRRPLLGYGFDAFWQGLQGESMRILVAVGWDVPHSHNGYLEALLGFGMVGGALVLLFIIRLGRDALLYVRANRTMAGLWPSAFLIFYLVHSFAEAGLIKRDGLTYLVVVVLSTSLSMERRRGALKVRSKAQQSTPVMFVVEPAFVRGE
jgi:exopolysaccharide production protein ExoQ